MWLVHFMNCSRIWPINRNLWKCWFTNLHMRLIFLLLSLIGPIYGGVNHLTNCNRLVVLIGLTDFHSPRPINWITLSTVNRFPLSTYQLISTLNLSTDFHSHLICVIWFPLSTYQVISTFELSTDFNSTLNQQLISTLNLSPINWFLLYQPY